ncbi:polysaccharide biosynthesis tyrosine autokinase [Bacteroides faecichinchillae]|uniref:GumC family protein n=1 Tax=Bacteroides faecichinchillae TaxID=871325 RepID=UPI0010A65837|nr:polysaccharide biosynthesis tyrosine autokinase [Bacteroides faecichinchillae]THG67277.1 polysaccharide biosynthesis tyrosine autokinase [Bacteroides faecichinchillae]
MKENSYGEVNVVNEEEIDLRELIFSYLSYWPWIITSVFLCFVGAWLYLYFTPPVYRVSGSIIIKDEKKEGNVGTAIGLENLGLGGMITASQNMDNEMEVLCSKSLLKKVVNDLELYITYKNEDEFPAKELYKSSPVIVSLTPQEADKLSESVLIDMKFSPVDGLEVKVNVGDSLYSCNFNQLPAVLPTDVGTFGFMINDSFQAGERKEVSHVSAVISQPMKVAKGYLNALTIKPTSKTTSVAIISLENTNSRRGRDFINKLLEMYNQNANNDKNEVAEKTRDFINTRIEIINKELGNTEEKLETFKRNAGLTNISSDAELALEGNAEYEKKRVANGTQINLIHDLVTYINDSSNEFEVLPGNIGLSDGGLSTQIDRYNELILERKRLLNTSTENNPAIINLTASIQAMKTNVRATMNGVLQGLLITKADLDREAKRFSRRISDAPGQERQYVSITRQQEIKAGLYLMLLQKREENAITLAATANNAKIIDEPIADDVPVSPRRLIIYLIALILGMGVPAAAIFLIRLFKFKIEDRTDVEKLTKIPIVGSIPLADEKQEKQGSIVVFENQNNLMSEAFRNIRTKLQFMIHDGGKVIMVTSTISGEGKSFVASNLAISLSLMGKRVVIVGLDLRKPGLNKVFSILPQKSGITQYLANPATTELVDLIQPSGINSDLYVLPGGTIPPNPTELLARDTLDKAIQVLKERFDYVILDTAPIGMVTDTLVIGRVADLSVYVCRSGYTRKGEYMLINELAESGKLPELCTIINGEDLSKRKYGYYGYGKYGGKYGYGKGYGYGQNVSK